LDGFEEDWVSPQRTALEEQYAQAVVRLMEMLGHAGEHAEGLRVGKTALAQLGCREDVHIGLIRLYAQSGTPSLALAQYEELERQLDEEWGEQPSDAARQALEDVPRPGAPAPRVVLSAPVGRVFGRDTALQDLATRLVPHASDRLVTLHGSAGSGKTTLAKHGAAAASRSFPGRTWFVDLTTCDSPGGIALAVARELGIVGVEASGAVHAVGHALGDAPALIVLDNLEHLCPAAGDVATALLSAAPGLILLTTSRRVLEVAGEVVVQVPPLQLPKPGSSMEELYSTPSVALYVARATASNPSFRLTPDNARAVSELVRQLDGLPLAISIAAGRAVTQSPAQTLARVSAGLFGGSGSGKGRQESLVAALDWSLGLLDPDARTTFLELSVFRTPFTMADAQALVSRPGLEEVVADLVKSSLVEARPEGDETSFLLFECFKEIGRERLGADRAEVERRHLAWARSLLQHKADAPRLVEREADLFAALEAPVDDAELATYALDLGVWARANDRLYRMAPVLERLFDARLEPRLRAAVGALSVAAGANVVSMERALQVSSETLALARDVGDPRLMLDACFGRGGVTKSSGAYDEAEALYREAAAIAAELDDPDALGQAYYNLGLTRYCVNDSAGSLDLHLKALEHARKGKDLRTLARILFDSGSELVKQGQPERGLAHIAESLQTAREAGSVRMEGLARWQEGEALRSMGDGPGALRSLSESLRLCAKAGFPAAIKWIALTVAGALVVAGEPLLGVRFLAKMTAVREAEGRPLAGYEVEDAARIGDAARAAVGEAGFDGAWSAGSRAEWLALVAELDKLAGGDQPAE
jgi:non-specific serine/threonine protein kinase